MIFGDVLARSDAAANRYVLVLSSERFISNYHFALVTPVFPVPEGAELDIESLHISKPFYGYLLPHLLHSVPIRSLGALVGAIDDDDIPVVRDAFEDALQPE
jgi:mRNA-degrading endonuclease toxin of MazEF toxin-antitoxin module